MTFTLEGSELQKYLEWDKTHYTKENCKYFDDGTEPVSPQGAIGGRETFRFTLTGIGMIVVVKCACGSEVDCSDYDHW